MAWFECNGGGNTPVPTPIPPLPDTYQRVQYLDFQGAYFDVSIPATSIWNTEFDTSEVSTTNAQGVWGYRIGSTNDEDFYLRITTNISSASLWSRNTLGVSNFVTASDILPNTKASVWNMTNLTRTSAYIGGYNIPATNTTKYAKYEFYGKLYKHTGYIIDDNGFLVPACDFVPCYRKSDNQVGLYERFSEIFYVPTLLTIGSSLGSITAGPDVN